MIKKWCVFLFLIIGASSLFAQQIDMDNVRGMEEFSWGLRAFQRGHYNEAILGLERALSYKPNNVLYREWLGRAYFYSGFEDAALDEWQRVLDSEEDHPVLSNWVQILLGRRGALPINQGSRLVSGVSIEGESLEPPIFLRPAGVSPQKDGTLWVSSYGMNQLLKVNVNGAVVDRFVGGLQGLDRPFDVLMSEDDLLYVSEFRGDRISAFNGNGFLELSFGETGTKPGQLLGPQYLAIDDSGNIYVSEWGNRRISKFDRQGNFLLHFGKAKVGFKGLKAPTGLAIHENNIYVADSYEKAIFVFDQNGNYIKSMGSGIFNNPEGISLQEPGVLLVADGNRVISYSVEDEVANVLWEAPEKYGNDIRILAAEKDINGQLWVPDFNNSRLEGLVSLSSMYSGFFVKINRIGAERFPEVWIEVSVEDPQGNPIVGLDKTNFYVSEGRIPIKPISLEASEQNIREKKAAFLIEQSQASSELQDPIKESLGLLLSSLRKEGADHWVVTAGVQPAIIGQPGVSITDIMSNSQEGKKGNLDLGIRLAASSLIPGARKKVLCYLTSGIVPQGSFNRFDLNQVASFLKNNHIRFDLILLSSREADPELVYLAEMTGGRIVHYLAPKGVTDYVKDWSEGAWGTYVLKYTSNSDSDFGRRYLPLEVEVLLVQRSGRDETGYLAPLE